MIDPTGVSDFAASKAFCTTALAAIHGHKVEAVRHDAEDPA